MSKSDSTTVSTSVDLSRFASSGSGGGYTSGDFTPGTAGTNGDSLGTSSSRWNSLYLSNNGWDVGGLVSCSLDSGGGATLLASGVQGFGVTGPNLALTASSGYLSLHADSGINANKTINTSSDERLKNIQENVIADINDIANIPVFNFTWKDTENDVKHLGTSAQSVKEIFPSAVVTTPDDHLAMDYGSVALASAVTAAKEIVELKKENNALKERIEALEARLQLIENKL